MKKNFFILILIILIYNFIITPIYAFEDNNKIINTDNISNGYYTINYNNQNNKKIKIGIIFNDKIKQYYNYHLKTNTNYNFDYGDGKYTIIVYENTRKNLYKRIATTTVDVKIENNLSSFLIPTYEISFSKEDLVSQTAQNICKNYKDNEDKVIQIQKYIKNNIKYDYTFTNKLNKSIPKNYLPNSNKTLLTKKGVCYDTASLFAAMCRSQNIPCIIEKGYYKGIYHAWNKVYINNKWYKVDPSIPITKNYFI